MSDSINYPWMAKRIDQGKSLWKKGSRGQEVIRLVDGKIKWKQIVKQAGVQSYAA